jgi:hypothetical protein
MARHLTFVREPRKIPAIFDVPVVPQAGHALAGRAARRAWDDQGKPIQPDVREAFDRDRPPGNGSAQSQQ